VLLDGPDTGLLRVVFLCHFGVLGCGCEHPPENCTRLDQKSGTIPSVTRRLP
jgi:hypothetical protein